MTDEEIEQQDREKKIKVLIKLPNELIKFAIPAREWYNELQEEQKIYWEAKTEFLDLGDRLAINILGESIKELVDFFNKQPDFVILGFYNTMHLGRGDFEVLGYVGRCSDLRLYFSYKREWMIQEMLAKYAKILIGYIQEGFDKLDDFDWDSIERNECVG